MKQKILLVITALLIPTFVFAQGTSDTSKMKAAYVDFFQSAFESYPYLFEKDASALWKQLSLEIENHKGELTKEVFFTIYQKFLNESFDHHIEEPNLVLLPAYRTALRDSEFGQQTFATMLKELQKYTGQTSFDMITVPGAGRFYEAPTVIKLLSPKKIIAQDINENSLEFSRGLLRGHKNIVFRHADLTQACRTDCEGIDLALFIHPQITDYDKLANSRTYRKYPSEFLVPLKKLQEEVSSQYMSPVWIEIIFNGLRRLKNQGHAFFIFYEKREMEIFLKWARYLKFVKVLGTFEQEGILEPLFIRDYLHKKHYAPGAVEFALMASYQVGVAIQVNR